MISSIALAAAAWVVPGVEVSGFGALLISALVLGFLNALLKPVLVVLTLPITCLTLGLFYFILNAALLTITAAIVPGLTVVGFGPAFLGALIVSLVSTFIGSMTRKERR
jgi:putative membrane protein